MATNTKTAKKASPKKTAEQISLPKAPEPVVDPADEIVEYIIPLDPDMPEGDQWFEYCLNGIVYRLKRGVVHKHPRRYAEAFLRKAELRARRFEAVQEFKNTSKKLNI